MARSLEADRVFEALSQPSRKQRELMSVEEIHTELAGELDREQIAAGLSELQEEGAIKSVPASDRAAGNKVALYRALH
jgi:hypothetical protein